MSKKVILTADSTCDLGAELEKRFNVAQLSRLCICYGEQALRDGTEITPDEIYERFYADGTLPKTSAFSVGEYLDIFSAYVNDGCEVVHISLGSGLSCSCSNAKLAAEQLEGVYVVDSQNLSTGSGLLVCEASEMIEQGMCAKDIAEKLESLVPNCHASFILDTLKFLAAGGRCSALASFGANLLSIKPGIGVDNTKGGAMGVGKKYRGKFEKCVEQYVKDQLSAYEKYNRKRVFITHSGIYDGIEDMVKNVVAETGLFDEIFVTRAGCTISSHCGPNCIGVLFMTE